MMHGPHELCGHPLMYRRIDRKGLDDPVSTLNTVELTHRSEGENSRHRGAADRDFRPKETAGLNDGPARHAGGDRGSWLVL